MHIDSLNRNSVNEDDADFLNTEHSTSIFLETEDPAYNEDYFEFIFNEHNYCTDIEEILAENPCPADQTYEEFRSKMNRVNDKIYKKMLSHGYGADLDFENHKIVYEYAMYLEGQSEPFDSTQLSRRCSTLHVSENLFPLPVHILALETMKFKEESIFWISHELMYGEVGVFPCVPPKADIMVQLKIKKVLDNFGNPVEIQISQYEKTLFDAGKAMRKGKQKFESGDYELATKIFESWIDKMDNLRFKNEEEDNKVQQYLVKMYRNLCICYNKRKLPKKTCIKMKLLEKLTPIDKDRKALYAKFEAMKMLDDFDGAKKTLKILSRLEPNSRKLKKLFDELNDRKIQMQNYESNFENLKEKFYAETNFDFHTSASDLNDLTNLSSPFSE